jgi:hypothetical protein
VDVLALQLLEEPLHVSSIGLNTDWDKQTATAAATRCRHGQQQQQKSVPDRFPPAVLQRHRANVCWNGMLTRLLCMAEVCSRLALNTASAAAAELCSCVLS